MDVIGDGTLVTVDADLAFGTFDIFDFTFFSQRMSFDTSLLLDEFSWVKKQWSPEERVHVS